MSTPELHRNVASRASALRARLNAAATLGGIDPVQAAQEARRMFEDIADDMRVRWLNLELGGYGSLVDARPLHDVLGVPAGHRLVAHVAAYRTHRAAALPPDPRRGPFQHFFVEPIGELAGARQVVRTRFGQPQAGELLEVDLRPRGLPDYPTRANFSRDVFERVVEGFVAVLYLQLGSATA
ncbi:MAG: hypothetical protein ABSF69_28175 [Polyangiaceae bacterium]